MKRLKAFIKCMKIEATSFVSQLLSHINPKKKEDDKDGD